VSTYTPFVSSLIDDAHVQDGAYADVSVKLGLIKILQKQFDLCNEAYVSVIFAVFEIPSLRYLRRNANTSVQCPVEKGTYEVEHTVALPKEIPQGELSSIHVAILLTSFGQPSSILTCGHTLLKTMTCFVSI